MAARFQNGRQGTARFGRRTVRPKVVRRIRHRRLSRRRLYVLWRRLRRVGLFLIALALSVLFLGWLSERMAHDEARGADAPAERPLSEEIMSVPAPSLVTRIAPPPRQEAAVERRRREVFRLPPPPERPAWQKFAAEDRSGAGQPAIVVVIDDLGLDHKAVRRLAALDGPLTLAFLPYAEGLDDLTAAARAAGHELMVHLPMEPKDDLRDPGPNALLRGLSEDEFQRRIDWNLARFKGYVGVNNHMGSALTEDRSAMLQVMRALRARGLLYLDSRTTSGSVAEVLAAEQGVPHAARDVFLDNEQSAEAVAANLAEAERIARRSGLAIVIGHPHPGTISTLSQWRKGLEGRGIALKPLSAVVSRTEPARIAATDEDRLSMSRPSGR